jgi:hypothetical protein
MSLQVIGSGFGRTGTFSLKLALEQLGFGPCHHMEQAFANPDQPPRWARVAGDDTTLWASDEWRDLMKGYRAQVDWPGAHIWRELAATYPEAKVIHSTRPEEKWWTSFDQTIGKFLTGREEMPLPPHIRTMTEAAHQMIGQKTFGGRWADKDTAIAAFRRREADVRAAIPPERLLVFNVAEGWEPLCAFLDVQVPDTDFPRTNDVAEFWSNFGPPE